MSSQPASRRTCIMKRRLAFGLLVSAGLAAVLSAGTQAAEYLGPIDVVASTDGQQLFVANHDARQVAVVDLKTRKVVHTIGVPAPPTALALAPDGAVLYVACAAPKSTICAIETATGKITASLPAGHTASALVIAPDGRRLYVCNRFDNEIAVIDLPSGQPAARVAAVREPIAAAITPDGKTVFVANLLPLDQSDCYDVAAMITVIDTETNQSSTLRLLNGSTGLRDICVSPNGKYVYVTHQLSRYQMPTTQLERGWMNTNALTIIDAAERKLLNTVLLDNVDLGAANPWGVATTADGALVCVAHAGTQELSVIDAAGLMEKLAALPEKLEDALDQQGLYSSTIQADVPNDLAFLVDLRRRIWLHGGGPYDEVDFDNPQARGARAVAVVGNTAYVTCYFTDNLAAVSLDPAVSRPVDWIPLGPKPQMTIQRKGEMLFHDALLCFQHWQSCSSCHPDARMDGLNWDLLNDGLGNPKNARSMLLAHRTPPSMARGVRATAEEAVRAGITHIQFAVRPEEDAVAIDEYLKALQPVPSPYLVDGHLSAAAQRGRKLFFDEQIGCGKCHPEPLYTDLGMHHVGSRGQFDRHDVFDTPTLVECWRTAPYMHDGHWLSIKELLTTGKHGRNPQLERLSDAELDDLVQFVLSL